jgi:hypothetical protein
VGSSHHLITVMISLTFLWKLNSSEERDAGAGLDGHRRRAARFSPTSFPFTDHKNHTHFGSCTLPFDQSSQMHSTDMRRDRPRVSDKSRDAVEGPTHDRRGLIKSRPDLLLRLRVN